MKKTKTMRNFPFGLVALAWVFQQAIVNSADAAQDTNSYLYEVKGKFELSDIEQQVQVTGGQLLACIAQVGICKVFYPSVEVAKRSGFELVPNVAASVPQAQYIAFTAEMESQLANYAEPPNSSDDDFFFDVQWGHKAVGAVESWNKGYRGAGVTVAVLDSGGDASHPDLVDNINVALSTSFVPNESWDYVGQTNFNHGSHVAGTIAAADNGYGVIGIAPEADLVIVKVLSADTDSGDTFGVMQGIIYAADLGVDLINMSIVQFVRRSGYVDVNGTLEDKSDDVRWEAGGNKGNARFINHYAKVVNYARQKGVTIIAAAGNEAFNYDTTDNLLSLPASLPGVLAISALAPRLWGKDSNSSTDFLASYSNYGQSTIDLSAPGGDDILQYMPGGLDNCTVGFLTLPCFFFDLVFSTSGYNGWAWSAGTSMAAPHVTGVAALILNANGGKMKPAQLEAQLRKLAEDLGKPGTDDIYGQGKVKAP